MKSEGLVWTIALSRSGSNGGTAIAVSRVDAAAILSAGGVVFDDGNDANEYDAQQEAAGYPGAFVDGVIDIRPIYVPRQ